MARQSDEVNCLSEDVRRLVVSQSVLRTDVAAAVNRQSSIEVGWDSRLAELDSRLAELDSHMAELDSHLVGSNSCLAKLDLRTPAFLVR